MENLSKTDPLCFCWYIKITTRARNTSAYNTHGKAWWRNTRACALDKFQINLNVSSKDLSLFLFPCVGRKWRPANDTFLLSECLKSFVVALLAWQFRSQWLHCRLKILPTLNYLIISHQHGRHQSPLTRRLQAAGVYCPSFKPLSDFIQKPPVSWWSC